MPILDDIKQAIETAIPDSTATIAGSGGHFEIDVVSPAFDSLRILAQQRLVLQAIRHLMAGTEPPVHAIDHLVCRIPSPQRQP